MRHFNEITAIVLAAALALPFPAPVAARTRKGDKYLAQGKARELKKDWDGALELYEQALSEDPADTNYRINTERARFQAAQAHVDKGLRVRAQGKLGEALVEFQKAYALNPSLASAEQEVRRTQQMIERERKRVEETGKEASPQEQALTPAQEAKKETQEKIASMLPVPELKPLNPAPINIKMNNQSPKVLFETVAKFAGVNILFDPEYTAGKNMSVEFNNSTLDQALDYLSVVTRSFWKPLSSNTIFVTNDNVTKRRDYEEQVMKVFYLSNATTAQELQEIVTAVRSVADIQRLFVYNAQNAIIARGEADRIALAEKIISDLDKPRSEVVVDILVMEASSVFSRKLTTAIASAGLNMPIGFTPRSGLGVVTQPSSSGSGTTTNGTTTGTTTTVINPVTGLPETVTTPTTGTTTPGTTTTGGTSNAIPLSHIGKVNFSDWSVVLPDALLQAVMSDGATKVLQAPQLRSVSSQKATLKIGDRQPTATGSFQPGIGGVGINPLVNTQFTYIDVGVNVDLTPFVHDNGDVTMHVEVEISSVNGTVNLGGIDQPIIGQRKVIHDVRMRDGEVNLLGGLLKDQNTRTMTGVPGLAKVPLLGRLFSGESVDRNHSELLIALIPHVLRRAEHTEENLKGIAVGNATVVKLNYAQRPAETSPAATRGPAVPPAAAGAAAAPKPATPPPPGGPGAPLVTTPSTAAPPATAPLTPPATAPPAPGPTNAPAPEAAQPQQPASQARVVFVPSQVDTTLSSGITVQLAIENAADAFSAPMQIRFDPKILRLNDVTAGGFLASDGQQVIFNKNILNDTGGAMIGLSRYPGSPGVSGSGTLLTLSFQAVGRGSTVVTVPNVNVRNAQSTPVATGTAELTVNVK